jgi:hypothetical protein
MATFATSFTVALALMQRAYVLGWSLMGMTRACR